MTELGTLIDVDIRAAWQHEAQHFTPWLAQHLDQLAAKIGIPLELEGQEVPVDTFSADILARNSLDNSRVLIENQLEKTDHTHLGQILTYLVGLDVRTVIWVAPEFRDAHLSALKWLNEHTANPYSFFAVRVKVVRINDSLPAPIFEVVERPNQWERYIQEIAPQAMSEIGQLRLAFWTHYIERHPEEEALGRATGTSSRWHVLREYGLVISMYVAREGVGLFVRGMHGADPQLAAATLAPHRERLAHVLACNEWNEEKGSFFHQLRSGDTADRQQWDMLCDWLHAATAQYTNALNECFGVQQ